jgi:pectin methylesterase-like acyl-CoA thioesterase
MIIAAHISALTKQLEAGLASLAIFTASWAVTDATSAAAASTAVACLSRHPW